MSYFVTYKRVERSQGLIFSLFIKRRVTVTASPCLKKRKKTSRKRGQIPDIMTLKETIT